MKVNSLYDLVGKKIKVKDSNLIGKVIEVNDNKLTLVNDHGAIFTINAYKKKNVIKDEEVKDEDDIRLEDVVEENIDDMAKPRYNKRTIQTGVDRNGEPIYSYINETLANDKYDNCSIDPVEDKDGYTGRYRAIYQKGIKNPDDPKKTTYQRYSIGSYGSRQEAEQAMIDFMDNYFTNEANVIEDIKRFKEGDVWKAAKLSSELARREKTQKGVNEHTEHLYSGYRKERSTSGQYTGIMEDNPKSGVGWQISRGMNRNGKMKMFDQVVIYGFQTLIDEYNRKLISNGEGRKRPEDILYIIKSYADKNFPKTNVFDYASNIVEATQKFCNDNQLAFNPNNLTCQLYVSPEYGRNADIYWHGNEKPYEYEELIEAAR